MNQVNPGVRVVELVNHGGSKRQIGVEESQIWTSRRGRGVISPARSEAMYMCPRVGDMRLAEISDAFGLASYANAGSGGCGQEARLR